MRRKLFTLLAGISLLMLIAAVGLGVRGYFRADTFSYQHTPNSSGGGGHFDSLYLTSSNGRLLWWVQRLSIDYYSVLTDEELSRMDHRHGLHHNASDPKSLYVGGNQFGETADRFGFGLETHSAAPAPDFSPSDYLSGTTILLPAWFLALLFALLPALRLRRYFLDRQRNRPGFCRQCGYDLRATPLRCPECGMVVDPSPVAGSE